MMTDERSLRDELAKLDWPLREWSRCIAAGGIRWHVQVLGNGPPCLLLHGTGASTHSWRSLAPLLAQRFTVVAPDLPGHGFTQAPATSRMTLPGMSSLLGDLLRAMDIKPALAIGHSAGAAILARMGIDGVVARMLLIAVNGALLPFEGVHRVLFPALARAVFLNSVVPRLFAWRAKNRGAVEAVIAGTGSTIDRSGIDGYSHLFQDPSHVAATLRMMAQWDLVGLERDLPRLAYPLVLIASGDDRAIPADIAFRVKALVGSAEVEYLRHVGHLAHEERPQLIADVVQAKAAAQGIVQTVAS